MPRRLVIAAAAAALSATLAMPIAVAQDNPAPAGTDRARLDEFDLPAASRSTGVQQLSGGPREVPSQPAADRDVSVERSGAPTGPLVQLTPAGEALRPVQRDAAQVRSARGVNDLSDRRDSAPGAATALSGNDLCDPQNRRGIRDADEVERCRRILELRAAEFEAPAPPELSAEQRIIAEQQRRDNGQGSFNPADMNARTLARTTDAESRSGQELASLVLSAPNGNQSAPPVAQENPAAEPALSELLQSLVIQLGAPPSP